MQQLILIATVYGWLFLQDTGVAQVDEQGSTSGTDASIELRSLDRNADDRLSAEELFRGAERQRPARGSSTGGAVPFLDRHRLLFEEADGNGDGALSEEEFGRAEGLVDAVLIEQWLWESAWPEFRQRDTDDDGSLSLEEVISNREPEQRQQWERDFGLVDFDGNGRASFGEYLCLPDVAVDRRGPVPDPVVAEVEQQLAGLQAVLRHTGSEGPWSRDHWPADEVAGFLSLQPLAGFDRWDRNGDGLVSAAELRYRLEVAWGVRHASGVLLRRETGLLFYWRAFHERDRNADLTLTMEEVREFDPSGLDQFQQALVRLDHNGDGGLSLAEAGRGSELFWKDTVGEFRQLDANRDGRVNEEELQKQVASWDQGFLGQVFPAFDEDGDGWLSFLEFRQSPLGNPYRNWRPLDANADGRISLLEYHGGSGQMMVELSRTLFGRLDRDDDGFLSLDEISFTVDLKTAPLPLVFQIRDENADGLLSLDEIAGAAPSVDLTSQTRREYERNLMRIEDGLRMADKDGNRMLSLAELMSNEEATAAIFHGRAGSRQPSGPSAPVRGQVEAGGAEWNFRLISLVTFNVAVLAGLTWLFFKPSTSR